MKKILIIGFIIFFPFHSFGKIDGKFLYCLSEKEGLRNFHLIGERMFYFRNGKVTEIYVTEDDPPKPVYTEYFPYKLKIDTVSFQNHIIWRKTSRMLTPTGVYLDCEVYNDGMKSLTKKIQEIIKKYKRRLYKNKL